MRFESLLWTVLALFTIGGGIGADVMGPGGGAGGREYQSADGGIRIPPGIVDSGTTSTVPAPLTK